MSDYVVTTEIKWTFILNVLLFITGLILGADIVIATSVIIFCILSVSIQILEAIHKINQGVSK